MNWFEYYKKLADVAASYQLPYYDDGETINLAEISRVSIEVQNVRQWFVNAFAHAQKHLQVAKRNLIYIKHQRKAKFFLQLAVGEEVNKCKTREQRNAYANALCSVEDEKISECELVITDWEAAVLTIEQYIKSVETAKVTLGRIHKIVVTEMENLN